MPTTEADTINADLLKFLKVQRPQRLRSWRIRHSLSMPATAQNRNAAKDSEDFGALKLVETLIYRSVLHRLAKRDADTVLRRFKGSARRPSARNHCSGVSRYP